MKKFLLFSSLLISLSIAGYYTYIKQDKKNNAIKQALSSIQKKHVQEKPELLVDVFLTKKETIYDKITVPGTIKFSSSIPIQNQNPGIIKKIYFTNGEQIKKNALLIQMDDNTAQENLEKEKAAYNTAKTSYERQVKAGFAISKEMLNQTKLSLDQKSADYHNALKDLKDTRITAPISGMIKSSSLNDYTEGSYISSNSTLATISSTQDLIAEYYLTAPYYHKITLNSPVVIDTTNIPIQTKVSFIDNAINEANNTFKVKANIPPSKTKGLLSGLTVEVTQTLSGSNKHITVPEIAIHADTKGRYVYLIDKQNKLQKAYITQGELLPNGRIIILSGIKDNTPVVIHGQRLKAGLPVKINKHLTDY